MEKLAVPEEHVARLPKEDLAPATGRVDSRLNVSAAGRHFLFNRVYAAMREPIGFNSVRAGIIGQRPCLRTDVFQANGADDHFVCDRWRHIPTVKMIRLLAAPQKVERITHHRSAAQQLSENLAEPAAQGEIADNGFVEKQVVDFDWPGKGFTRCVFCPHAATDQRTLKHIDRRVAEGGRLSYFVLDEFVDRVDLTGREKGGKDQKAGFVPREELLF